MKPIKAIETEYAGCRFRSRLEARWAVFFDALGTPWEYEPQGYEGDGGRYLPDFWLPEMGVWAEVKGVFSHKDFLKTMLAVPALREPFDHQIMPQLVLLGPIPRPGDAWIHIRVDVFHDVLLWQQAFFSGPHWFLKGIHQAWSLAVSGLNRLDDGPENEQWSLLFRDAVVDPAYDPRLTVDPIVDEAYRAARSARFEFGERG